MVARRGSAAQARAGGMAYTAARRRHRGPVLHSERTNLGLSRSNGSSRGHGGSGRTSRRLTARVCDKLAAPQRLRANKTRAADLTAFYLVRNCGYIGSCHVCPSPWTCDPMDLVVVRCALFVLVAESTNDNGGGGGDTATPPLGFGRGRSRPAGWSRV
jgi:hypothetical protein